MRNTVRGMAELSNESIAANLRAEVARQNLTQQQMADRLGVGQWWVSRRLTGEVRVSAADLTRFAEALGVGSAVLLSAERVA
jgi:transcriptional regulator with XRE-family HTH domain